MRRKGREAQYAGSYPAWGAKYFSVYSQVVCRLLWEQELGCSIHPTPTSVLWGEQKIAAMPCKYRD
jgi:hypothetical protein